MISVSIVSHGHGDMVVVLLRQLLACPEVAQVIITRNLPENLELPGGERVLLLDNGKKPGRKNAEERNFAANLGIALEDMAVAPLVYKKAKEKSIGTWLSL